MGLWANTGVVRPDRSTDVHERHAHGQPKRPAESTQLSGAGRSIGRPTNGFGWSTGRSTGGTTVINMTVAPVDRVVDRKVNFDLSRLPTGRFLRGYKYSSLELVSSWFLRAKFSHLLKCFSNKFSRVFGDKRFYLYLFSRVGKIKEKQSIWDIGFDLHFYLHLAFFPSIFLCVLISKHLVFLTLELSIYPIY